METNGHSHVLEDGEIQPRREVLQVRLFRVETTEPVFVRMLSPEYHGLFTHYHQKRSVYCPGEGQCKVPSHHQDRVWKGYCAALWLVNQKKNVWAPVCLEITEYLELDFRDVYERGQLWELSRMPAEGRKKSPISGKLHADPAPPNLPKPFDILPCLRAIYHRDKVDLTHKSPIPPRVYLEPFSAPLPEILQPKQAEMADPNQSMAEEFRKRARMAAENKPSPTAQKPAYKR